ncbi:MAG TPA: TonB family protein [Nitrospirota bacterium]|nr:TonB family protein [Nitrospirota bacterium]
MRHSLGRKIGQSGNELVLAVLFSSFLHAALVALALFIIFAVHPKIYVPPFYEVKLVRLNAPASSEPSSAAPATPAPPKPEAAPPREKPKELVKKELAQHEKVLPNKEALPAFSSEKAKALRQAPVKTEARPAEPAARAAPVTAPSAAPSASTGKPGGKTENVAVSSSSEELEVSPYIALVRDKIQQNWNPPPGVAAAKAKVEFTVLRSGRVGDAKLLASSSNFYFDQAAVRAILMSSPFPPMPEGFYKDYAVFTVDLQENE